MRHLYVRIYVTIVIILVLFGLLSAALWWLGPGQESRHESLVNGLALLASHAIPPPEAPRADIDRVLLELANASDFYLTLRAADGALVAHAGPPIELPSRQKPPWLKFRAARALVLRLPDERWLVGQHRPRGHLHGPRWLWAILLLALAVAVGAYPVARRITRRLENLQQNVEALGAGNLGARVAVQGRDEVAELARSFNVAAEKIEQLVESQRRMLASASHELRSPLARIRVASELLDGTDRDDLRQRIEADIAELDGLIDELLLASRLQTVGAIDRTEKVDLLAVAAEECARVNAKVTGESATIEADPRLMHRLMRNLVQNAMRHAGGAELEVEVSGRPEGGGLLAVSDRGPGVAQSERERIFEPFYRPPGTPESGEGVGLGLALVRQIARQYGGSARCLPRSGGGSRFEVTLNGRASN